MRNSITSKKIIGLVTLICIMVVLSMSGCRQNASMDTEKIKIEGIYAIDVDNPRELIGDADYAFVAQIKEKSGVEDLSDEREMPYTIYGIEILQNVKGNLKQGITISLEKAGGYSKTENDFYEYEEDYLPEKGDICIFYAYATEAGELMVSGANSTVKIGEAKKQEARAASEAEWEKEKAYKDLIEAAKHPILTDRVHGTSKYDEKAGN